MKVNMEILKEKFSKSMRTVSRVALIAAAVLLGIISHDIYQRIATPKTLEAKMKFQDPKTIDGTSIAINERGELMVIDRTTGSYQLYKEEVGNAIFNMYAGRIYSKNTSK